MLRKDGIVAKLLPGRPVLGMMTHQRSRLFLRARESVMFLSEPFAETEVDSKESIRIP
jgi:hypothetical protein